MSGPRNGQTPSEQDSPIEREPTRPAKRDEIDVALSRSYLYQWLSRACRYPDADLVESLQEPGLAALEAAYNRLAPGGHDTLHPVLASLRASCTDLDLAGLQSDHHRVFGHIESSPCPPYETRYSSRHLFQQTYQLSDIAGFYRAFGLDISDDADERPDYLAIELEFLHFLCFKEAYALEHHGPEQVELCRDAEVKFLRDHLLLWAPSFAKRLQETAGGVFYAHLATLMRAFLTAEAARWGCSPEGADMLQPIEFLPEGCNFSCGPDRQEGGDLINEREGGER